MIQESLLKKMHEQYAQNTKAQATGHAVASVGVIKATTDTELLRRHPFTFSVEVKAGEITNQKQSGRCWMFASLNAARIEVMQKLDMKTFEFSQCYPLFWDKLEKSNYFLESIIDTYQEEIHSRLLDHLLKDPLQDGGQWDMFSGLLKKYGAVPKTLMPETANSSATFAMDTYLTYKLQEYACELRNKLRNGEKKETVIARKEEMLTYIYQVLCQCLGEPPQKFDFAYYDKDEKYHILKDQTPVQFFNDYVGWDLDNKVSLIHAPTKDKPFNRRFTVKYLGSVKEGHPIDYVNVEMDVLKDATIRQLKAGEGVWFGCDVGKFLDRENAIMDERAHRYAEVFGEDLTLNKAERLDYCSSLLTHAMVIAGVDLDENGKPKTWKIENSWGEHGPKKGIYSMSDAWFDQFTYEVMVDKKYVDQAVLDEAFKQDVIELEPWDPMGSLAR